MRRENQARQSPNFRLVLFSWQCFTLDDLAAVWARTPLIADLRPGGAYVAKDVYDIGGVPVILRVLLDGSYLHGECLTVSGQTLAEAMAATPAVDGKVVRAGNQFGVGMREK